MPLFLFFRPFRLFRLLRFLRSLWLPNRRRFAVSTLVHFESKQTASPFNVLNACSAAALNSTQLWMFLVSFLVLTLHSRQPIPFTAQHENRFSSGISSTAPEQSRSIGVTGPSGHAPSIFFSTFAHSRRQLLLYVFPSTPQTGTSSFVHGQTSSSSSKSHGVAHSPSANSLLVAHVLRSVECSPRYASQSASSRQRMAEHATSGNPKAHRPSPSQGPSETLVTLSLQFSWHRLLYVFPSDPHTACTTVGQIQPSGSGF